MSQYSPTSDSIVTKVLRWTARVLSLPILVFWAFMAIGHVVGDEGRPSRPLVVWDYVLIGATAAALGGLAAAWKWERAGSLITLTATSVAAVVNWRVLMFPMTIIPIVALLFLLSWWLSRVRVRPAT